MTKKPKKSLGQIVADAPAQWWDTDLSIDIDEYTAQAVKRAVLREVKPKLDQAQRDAAMLKHYRDTLETIADGKTRAGRLARSALGFADALLGRDGEK